MGKCGCDGATCACRIVAGTNIRVTGSGSAINPVVISSDVGLTTRDTSTIDITLLGGGSSSDPFILEADVTAGLDDLTDVDLSAATTGQVLARQADGTWQGVPPATAAPGTVAVGTGLTGDGSGGSPLNARLAAQSGMEITGTGMRLDPYIVASEAALDSTYGTVQEGTFVSLASGAAAWIKTTSGWAEVISDSGTITTVSGNITASSGWTIQAIAYHRRNGIVQVTIQLTPTSALSTSVSSGDVANWSVCTIVPAEFRPIMTSSLRQLGSGPDHGWAIATSGLVSITNYAQPDVTFAAGVVYTIGGTYIGA